MCLKYARCAASWLAEQQGRGKIQQFIPAAIRHCLERQPEIVGAIRNAHYLLGSDDARLPASELAMSAQFVDATFVAADSEDQFQDPGNHEQTDQENNYDNPKQNFHGIPPRFL